MSKYAEVCLTIVLCIILIIAVIFFFITLEQKKTIDTYETKYNKLLDTNKKNIETYNELQNSTKRIMKIADGYKTALDLYRNSNDVCSGQLAHQRAEYQQLASSCEKLAKDVKEQKDTGIDVDDVFKFIQLITMFG